MQNRMFSSKSVKSKIGLLGVPYNEGTSRKGIGTELAPQLIRKGGLVKEIEEFNEHVDIKDFGDLAVGDIKETVTSPKNMLNYTRFMPLMKKISESVQEIRAENRICVTLGGDHALAVGTISGQLNSSENLSLLYVDAHADINTNTTSRTGNIHGMPVAFVVKELSEYWGQLPGFDWQTKKLSLKNVAYIGLRSVDPMEKLIAEKFNIKMLGMEYVDKYGINKCIEMAMDHIDPKNNRDYHISFDIDALDRREAPSTGISLPGGLSLREGIRIIERIYETGRLRGLDMVEVCPNIGDAKDVKTTIDSAIQLIVAASGHKRSGNLPLTQHDIPRN